MYPALGAALSGLFFWFVLEYQWMSAEMFLSLTAAAVVYLSLRYVLTYRELLRLKLLNEMMQKQLKETFEQYSKRVFPEEWEGE